MAGWAGIACNSVGAWYGCGMNSEVNNVYAAREMALKAHGDQKYGEKPYSVHLDAVADLCRPFGEDAVVVAFLHDAFEDTDLSRDAVVAAFGEHVAACVSLLSDPPGANRKARKAAAFAAFSAVPAGSDLELALLVKAADRLANVRAGVDEDNKSLLSMYRKEHAAFSAVVSRPGLNDALVAEASRLLGL